jgi:outer membrane protein
MASAAAPFLLACGLGLAVPAQGQEDAWRVSVGGGVFSQPTYPGSDSQETRILPLVSASYGRFFIFSEPGVGSVGAVGYNFYRGANLRLSAGVSAGITRRKESDDPRLTGLGDVDRTLTVGVGGIYRMDWVTARARIATDIGGNDQGTLARFDLSGRFRPGGAWVLSAGPGLEWANDRYMRTFFGVDAVQSTNSGYPQFAASGGITRVIFSTSAVHPLGNRWAAGITGWVAQLQGDAADSPITQDKSQHFIGAFASYRFGNAATRRDLDEAP